MTDYPRLLTGSLLELHFRLARLSAMLVATDPPSSAFKQLTFPASPFTAHPNPVFRPNMFRKAFGTDMVRMGDYYRYAVKSEAHCLAALEEECSNEPSVVLHPDHRWDDGTPRVISDCHFRETATEYDRKPGIKWLSCTAK